LAYIGADWNLLEVLGAYWSILELIGSICAQFVHLCCCKALLWFEALGVSLQSDLSSAILAQGLCMCFMPLEYSKLEFGIVYAQEGLFGALEG